MVIIDNCLYLCDDLVSVWAGCYEHYIYSEGDSQPPIKVSSECYDYYIFPSIEDHRTAFEEKRTFDDWWQIRLIPLEELIGRKFRKMLPVGIYNYPFGSGYVVAADWFSGGLKIMDVNTDLYGPYQRLTFKEGRLISVQQLIYYYREFRKKDYQRTY